MSTSGTVEGIGPGDGGADAVIAVPHAGQPMFPEQSHAAVPLLQPNAGGPAERFAGSLDTHPAVVFFAALLLGYAALATATIGLGLFVTRILLAQDSIARWDVDVVQWLAERRTPLIEDASWAGTTLAGGHVIPVVVGTLLVVFCWRREWLLAAFALFAVGVESATYRATTLVVERQRPPVERLESLPADASFPSGHTAASVALFGGLLLVAASSVRRRWFTVLVVALTLALVAFVGWSRMARGMHHPLDVLSAVPVGALAIVVTVFACRAASAAGARRERG